MTIEFTLQSLFCNPPLPPNTYQLHAPPIVKNAEDLFQFVYHIYKEGCIILFGNRGSFQLTDLTLARQFRMKQYMRSCGIRPQIWVYSKQDIHDIYEKFQFDVTQQNIPIHIHLQKRGRYIYGVRMNVPTSNEEKETLSQLHTLVKNNHDYLNVMNITIDKDDMSLYKVSANVGGVLYVLRFFWE